MKLPEKHVDNLYEHASIGAPTPGSDALAAYQQLYALYFTAQEYLKAAAIAHSLYRALERLLRCVPGGALADLEDSLLHSFEELRTGDCLSEARDVPAKRRGAGPAAAASSELLRVDGEASGQACDQIWGLLDQQRAALLMALTALSLTPERLLVVPPPQRTGELEGPREGRPSETLAAEPGDGRAPALEEAAKNSFASATFAAADCVVSVKDIERLLAVIEARLILCGQEEGAVGPPEGQDARTIAGVARRVAELGLLLLALRLARVGGLDPWPHALRPFVRLCVEAGRAGGSEAAAALAAAARGPAMAFMFVRSDGGEPLGCGGDVVRGWWQTLEEGLRSLAAPRHPRAGSAAAAPPLDAGGARLFSLVADEILSLEADAALPRFLTKALAEGPAWPALLRLYMKHRRLDDAAELLHRQLRRCEAGLAPGRGPAAWSPLQDFPVALAVQLQRCVAKEAQREAATAAVLQRADGLEAVLAHFRRLLREAEPGPSAAAAPPPRGGQERLGGSLPGLWAAAA